MQYIIPAFLVFLGSLFLWLIKRPRRSMFYSVIKLPEYKREGMPIRSYALRIWSRGNRPIDDIHVTISLDAGQLAAVDPTKPELIKGLSVEQNRAQLAIPLLNPREGTEIMLSVTNPVAGAD